MKLKKRLKGVADIRTHAPGAPRDPLPMMRAYQQAAIDESRIRAATVPPTKAVAPAKPVKSMPIRYAFGGADESPETRHWIEVAGKRYFCDEIDEAAARAMVADVQAAGQSLSADEVEAAIEQLVETGRFWSRHEAKQKARREAQSDPIKANAAGVAYTGPAMPDKGRQDGSCNRTACQMPLKGKTQFFMRDYLVEGGRLHYCADCARLFDESDRQFGDPRRCTELTEENRA